MLDAPSISNYDPLTFAELGTLVTFDALQLIDNVSRISKGIYLQYEDQWWQGGQTVLGVRHDRVDGRWQATTPRLAISHQVNASHQLRFQLANAFRVPSISDLSAAGNPLFIADPNIKPMHERSAEVGWRFHHASFDHNLMLYTLRIDDFIAAFTRPDGVSSTGNIGSVNTRGMEWDGVWQISENWLLRAGIGHAFYRNSAHLPPSVTVPEQFAARTVLSMALNWQQQKWNLNLNAWWYSGVDAIAHDNGDAVFNLHWRYQLTDDVEMSLTGSNMTNTQQLGAEPGGGLGTRPDGQIERVLPQPGRHWWAGVNWRW